MALPTGLYRIRHNPCGGYGCSPNHEQSAESDKPAETWEYPLDKYLRPTPSQTDLYAYTGHVATPLGQLKRHVGELRKDVVNAVRLLEPVTKDMTPPDGSSSLDSSENWTEDLVASEFYRASVGALKSRPKEHRRGKKTSKIQKENDIDELTIKEASESRESKVTDVKKPQVRSLSVAPPTVTSYPPLKHVKDTCVNTDKINTSVWHIEAVESPKETKGKKYIVQALPKVSIRPTLTKQSFPVIDIKPVKIAEKVDNIRVTAVVHSGHVDDPGTSTQSNPTVAETAHMLKEKLVTRKKSPELIGVLDDFLRTYRELKNTGILEQFHVLKQLPAGPTGHPVELPLRLSLLNEVIAGNLSQFESVDQAQFSSLSRILKGLLQDMQVTIKGYYDSKNAQQPPLPGIKRRLSPVNSETELSAQHVSDSLEIPPETDTRNQKTQIDWTLRLERMEKLYEINQSLRRMTYTVRNELDSSTQCEKGRGDHAGIFNETFIVDAGEGNHLECPAGAQRKESSATIEYANIEFNFADNFQSPQRPMQEVQPILVSPPLETVKSSVTPICTAAATAISQREPTEIPTENLEKAVEVPNTLESAQNESEPILKFTKRNSGSVEIRLPEARNKFKSSIVLNSNSNNEEIKLSYECSEGTDQADLEKVIADQLCQFESKVDELVSGRRQDEVQETAKHDTVSSQLLQYMETKVNEMVESCKKQIREEKEPEPRTGQDGLVELFKEFEGKITDLLVQPPRKLAAPMDSLVQRRSAALPKDTLAQLPNSFVNPMDSLTQHSVAHPKDLVARPPCSYDDPMDRLCDPVPSSEGYPADLPTQQQQPRSFAPSHVPAQSRSVAVQSHDNTNFLNFYTDLSRLQPVPEPPQVFEPEMRLSNPEVLEALKLIQPSPNFHTSDSEDWDQASRQHSSLNEVDRERTVGGNGLIFDGPVRYRLYDSEMSDGEIGFTYTSNSYSSGEILPPPEKPYKTLGCCRSISDSTTETTTSDSIFGA